MTRRIVVASARLRAASPTPRVAASPTLRVAASPLRGARS